MKPYPKIDSIYKRDQRGEFLLGEYSCPEIEYLANNDWVWTEKVDGCLHYCNDVITDKGLMPIGRIVEKKLPVNILSYNEILKIVEYKKIEHYHKEKNVRPFVCVTVKSRNVGNKPKHIVCTDNHKFYSNGRWVEAKNLIAGQMVSHLTEGVPSEIKQVILGGLLGDSSIYRPSITTRGFSFIHSKSQSEYFEFKKMILGNLFREHKGSIGGFLGSKPNRRGSCVINRVVSDFIISHCETSGAKRITKRWADELLPLGLAIWYMDDGSAHFPDNQRPRVRFATNAFSLEEVRLLQDMFKTKYNIDSKVFDYKGWTLILTANGSEKFFSIVFPFICNSMKYKLPKQYRGFPCTLTKPLDAFPTITDAEIISVSGGMPAKARRQQTYQYDLSVKDNSNYFTNSILVHNTNCRVIWDCETNQPVLFRGRTNNAQLPTFLFERLQEMFTVKKMERVFPDTTLCLYGEGYGAKIQKGGGNYKPDGVDFVLFDVRIGEWWLKREDVEDIAKQLGIRVVPVVGEGCIADAVSFVMKGFESTWGDFPAEGLVLRPKVFLRKRNGERVITKVKHKDFNKEN